MGKYFQIFKINWQSSFVYRLNFIMWRVRTMIWFLASYFFWVAIFSQHEQVFTYDRSVMLTYILGAALLRSFVLASRSITVGTEIATGDLNNYLVKPLSYLKNWLSRDLSDKVLNLLFFTFELLLIIIIIKPPLILPQSLLHLFAFLLSAVLAMMMYFFFSFIVSSFTFWYPEHNGWPLRFIVFMLLGFFAGESFPLDIFPQLAQKIFSLLPFSYFIFYPLQIYLGRLSNQQIILVYLSQSVWLILLFLLTRFIFKKGLKIYGAYGR
jgi:ABC-2 type transport system permease protein